MPAITRLPDMINQKINDIDILDQETEQRLARAWRDNQDQSAMNTLINAHLKLARKIAKKYAQNDQQLQDLLQEGSIGLLRAVAKFDPDTGFRFSTYAYSWITAQVRDFVFLNRSMVKVGNSQLKRRLYSNMHRAKDKIEREAAKRGQELTSAEVNQKLADLLAASVDDVEQMTRYFEGVGSLDIKLGNDGDSESNVTLVDRIQDENLNQEDAFIQDERTSKIQAVLNEAMVGLTDRERRILDLRQLCEPEDAVTLEDLSKDYNVSRERVRQIEAKAIQKLSETISNRNRHLLLEPA